MAKMRDNLPDPPGCGGWVGTLMLACVLVALNSSCTLWIMEFLSPLFPWQDARIEQILLFLLPLLLMLIELRLIASVWRMCLPGRNGGMP